MNTLTAAELGDEHLGRQITIPLIGDYGHESAAGTLQDVGHHVTLGRARLTYVRIGDTVYTLRSTDEVVLS